MNAWRIHLFGTLQVQRGQTTLPRLSMRRTGALLAYLVMRAPNQVSRQELLALLWPEEPTEVAQNRLRVLLSSLRKQLEAEDLPGCVIHSERHAVQIEASAFTSDYHDFTSALLSAKAATREDETLLHLENAVALYRGELLAGFCDEWILAERNHFETLYYQTLRDLVRGLTQAGEAGRSIDYARRAVAAEPLDEEAHCDLIRLYQTVGQPSAALRQYEQLKRVLREEMQAQPCAATRQLAADIEAAIGHGVKPNSVRSVRPMTIRPSEQARIERTRASTLPQRMTRFFARSEEMAQLRSLLSPDGNRSVRLVSLLGPGGMGKTRLALEAAEHLREAYQQNVYFVPLADVTDPNHVGIAIAKALRLPPTPGLDPLLQVIEVLSETRALLILDNLEQLGLDVGAVVAHLLLELPELRCLLTSRRSAGVEGEQEIVLGGLAQPLPGADMKEIATSPSIALFIDRVRLVRSDFVLTAQNAEGVTHLSLALQGLPLAIELAAARARVMTPSEMWQKTGKLLNLLVDAQSRKTARHRSLRATLEWSFRLLTLEERRFFSALSVFTGGFTADAACYVALGEHGELSEALSILERLHAASLLTSALTERDTMRFSMLDTLREFGMERLEETGKDPEVRSRHLTFFAALCTESAESPRVTDIAETERLVAEDGNLREALEYGLRPEALPEEQKAALYMADALFGYWDVQGRWREGRDFLTRAASLPDVKRWGKIGTDTLRCAAILANQMGDSVEARALSEKGLAMAASEGDTYGMAGCVRNLGNIALARDDYAEAQARLEESLALYQQLEDAANIAATLVNLSNVAFFVGDHKTAQDRVGKALTIYRTLDDKQGIATALNRLGNVRRNQSYFEEGRAYLLEAADLFREIGHRHGAASCQQSLGFIEFVLGEYDQAVNSYTEAMNFYQDIGSTQGVTGCNYGLALVAHSRGDFEGAIARFTEALEFWRKAKSRRNMASCLLWLANVLRDQERYSEAREHVRQALEIEREIGSLGGIANCFCVLGSIAIEQNELEAARRYLHENLRIFHEMGVQAGVLGAVEDIANLAQLTNSPRVAVLLAGAARVFRNRSGFPRSFTLQRWDARRETLRSILGEGEYANARRQGETLAWDEAVALALKQTVERDQRL